MSVVSVSNLTKYYGAELIFGDVSFQVSRGDKLALVGINGAGKSTLLKIISSVETPSSGGVHMPRGTRVAVLAQEARFSSERTLWEEMHASVDHLNELREAIAGLETDIVDTEAPEWEERMERYGELTHRFELAGGYDFDRRIEMILTGLGFREEQFQLPPARFSGGQKTRAALAASLLSDPDVLLLDEPTNHLDLAAIEWLERFLKEWEGTLVVVSHDRYFLDKVTTRTIEIAYNRLDGDYPGGYEKYLVLKAAKLEVQLKQYTAQQEQIAKTEEFIRRFKNSTLSTQARGRERQLNRLKEGWEGGSGRTESLIAKPEEQKKLAAAMKTEIRGADLVLKIEKLAVGYPARAAGDHAKTLIEIPNLEVWRGQRVALMGENGGGKTTLLRTIVGELAPQRGYCRLGNRVVINYYAQSHEGLNASATVIDEIRRIKPDFKETQVRTLLGRFLFSGDDVFKRVGDLSGGERSRVALAQLTLMGGNLMVLDEPTNHLDIGAREALEEVLNEYNGTIMFVSHDRYFVDAVADTLWMVQDGKLATFDGNYSEYVAERDAKQRRIADQEREVAREAARQQKQAAKAASSKPASAPKLALATAAPAHKPIDKDTEKTDRKRKRKLLDLEQEIGALEAELKQIERDMTAAGASGDGKKVTSLSLQYAEVQTMVQRRYDEWSASAA